MIAAIPAGVVFGVIADVALSASTVHAAPQDQVPALLTYACLGAVFAAVAGTGAVLAVLLEPSRDAPAATPFARIALGAGGAVFLGVIVLGGVTTAISDSWEWFSFYIVVAVVTGLIAAAGATGLTAFFQFRHRLLP